MLLFRGVHLFNATTEATHFMGPGVCLSMERTITKALPSKIDCLSLDVPLSGNAGINGEVG